ncbi:MAG: flagellar brake protein, partial [Thiobacillaceae bacterium]
MKDALIPVRKADIAIGKPLPWAVYDAHHVLLLNKGVVVTSEHQLETLIEKGLYREGRPRALDPLRPQREEMFQDQPLEGGVDMPFDRLHLAPGDLLQMQVLQEGGDERYNVRLIGMLKGKSVLVTHPVVDETLIFVREGQNFLVRAFSGMNACGFKTRVLKANLTP